MFHFPSYLPTIAKHTRKKFKIFISFHLITFLFNMYFLFILFHALLTNYYVNQCSRLYYYWRPTITLTGGPLQLLVLCPSYEHYLIHF